MSRWLKSLTENSNLEHVLSQLESHTRDESTSFELTELFEALSDVCQAADKRIVLLIDAVDSVTNNQVFLYFLAQLRAYYIRKSMQATFLSVILSGVYDVKNLKRKLRPEDDHKVNSPWNIATDFNVDMSFSPNLYNLYLATSEMQEVEIDKVLLQRKNDLGEVFTWECI